MNFFCSLLFSNLFFSKFQISCMTFIPPQRYADNLEQLPAEKKISSDSSSWKCEEGDTKENLWLNLSTGYIG